MKDCEKCDEDVRDSLHLFEFFFTEFRNSVETVPVTIGCGRTRF